MCFNVQYEDSESDSESEPESDLNAESDDEQNNDNNQASDEENSDNIENQVDKNNSIMPKKRKRSSDKKEKIHRKLTRRKRKDFKIRSEKLIEQYYASTWYGTSLANITYAIASEMSKGSNDLLWYAIVGLTDQIVYEHIDIETYKRQIRLLKDEEARLNVPSTLLPSFNNLGSSNSHNTNSNDLFLPAHLEKNNWIRYSEEYRFILIRHWSLYEAMLHSSFVISKFQMWKEKGRKLLDNLLASMGYEKLHNIYFVNQINAL